MTAIENLNKATYEDISLVGGKAASLGELLQADLPVPAGFVVTTDAFRTDMTPDVVRQIQEEFDKLGAPRVAVRSSAVAEDSADASWAGQLESYLNVTKDGLIEAVSKCWRSIESNRAKHYADEHNVNKADRAVAVVVQQMVDSEISGVMFTANPITGSRDEIMIEAVYGLGEMIVQGMVTPESIVTDKVGNVMTRSHHRQTKQLVYKNGENREIEVDSKLQDKEILTDKQIKELLDLAQKIEKHYGSPQDIEWAHANGEFYIVQSRPITTLPDQSVAPFVSGAELFRWGPIRGYYFLISDYVTVCYEYLPRRYPKEYFPETLLLFRDKQMVWLSDLEAWLRAARRVFQEYIEDAGRLKQMRQEWQKAVDELTQVQINVIPARLEKLSDKDFIAVWEDFYNAMMNFWVSTLLPELGNYGAPGVLKEDLSTYITDEEELIRAQEVLTTPEELSFYQQEEFQLIETTDLSAHQAKYFWLKNSYGHVGVLDESFFRDRQAELIKSVKAPSQQELKQKVRAAKTKMQKQYGLPGSLMRRAKLISDNVIWQDHRKRIMSENFHYKKLLLGELARRVHVEFNGLLNIGFADAIELLKGDTFHKRGFYHGVQFQKSLTDLSSKQVETYWDDYAHHKTENINAIHGTVASKGKQNITRGKVRVLHSSHDVLESGEILVTAMTSPGYVFAMRQAAGVITDIGGLTSHAAIVAREIGVPCIVGTKIATQVLKTGDMVEIDTTKGTIKIINKE